MHPIAFFKPFGLVAIAVLIAGLTTLVVAWPQGTTKTFSQHAAARAASIAYYAALFAIVLPLLVLFFVGWFVPARHISRWFDVLITLSAALQYSVTLIPEVGGWKTIWHQRLTFCSVLLLPLCLVLASAAVHGASRIVCVAGALGMLAIGLYAGIRRNNLHHVLLLQAMLYASFFAAIFFVVYA